MGEAKPRSYRLDDETVEKIKSITDEIGGGQQIAFERMAEAYSIRKAIVALGEDRESLEEFERYSGIINRMFLEVVEEKRTMREAVRTEFNTMLASKDDVIQDLQKKIKELLETKEDATKRASALQKDNRELLATIQEAEEKLLERQAEWKEKLKDKDNLNQTLNESCAEMRTKIARMESAVLETEKVIRENAGLQRALMEQRQEYEKKMGDVASKHQEDLKNLEDQLNGSAHARDQVVLEGERKLLALKEESAEEMRKLTEKMQNMVDSYQQKYMDLLERMGSGEAGR